MIAAFTGRQPHLSASGRSSSQLTCVELPDRRSLTEWVVLERRVFLIWFFNQNKIETIEVQMKSPRTSWQEAHQAAPQEAGLIGKFESQTMGAFKFKFLKKRSLRSTLTATLPPGSNTLVETF